MIETIIKDGRIVPVIIKQNFFKTNFSFLIIE